MVNLSQEIFFFFQRTVIYHVYVPSFYDSDGDGLGDLDGIRLKLAYLETLGVDRYECSSNFLFASKRKITPRSIGISTHYPLILFTH